MYTKASKKEMAIITIEDIYGTFDCMIFPNVFDRYKGVLEEDKIISISGKLSVRDNEAPVVIIESLRDWKLNEKKEEPKTTEQKLYIKFDTNDKAIYNKVMLILRMYAGDCPVICKCTSKNQAFKINKQVNPSNLLINELIGVLGEGSVLLVDSNNN